MAPSSSISTVPEKFPHALVAHEDNGGEIARVGGLYVSSELAETVEHSKIASLAVFSAQLRATQASLARFKRRHVFRLMDLPGELRMMILVMLVKNQCDIGEFKYRLPAIAAAGNEQLRLETILAALQNNVFDTLWQCDLTPKWLETVNFGALQKAGMTCPRDGFSAVRAVDISRCSGDLRPGDQATKRLLGRFENLRDLLVICTDATRMFEIGLEHGSSGDALGAQVRECNLDLPSLDLPNLRELTVTVRFSHTITLKEWMCNIEPYVPNWRAAIEDGCKEVARWLSDEYSARGLRVTVVVQTALDDGW